MNEHVYSYCRDFIVSDKSPQFAVFIKGDWGCGKTFFINELTTYLPIFSPFLNVSISDKSCGKGQDFI